MCLLTLQLKASRFVTPRPIALAFSLTDEAVEDNLYDSLGRRYVKALARSMANAKVKGADVLNNALTKLRWWDGQPLSLQHTHWQVAAL